MMSLCWDARWNIATSSGIMIDSVTKGQGTRIEGDASIDWYSIFFGAEIGWEVLVSKAELLSFGRMACNNTSTPETGGVIFIELAGRIAVIIVMQLLLLLRAVYHYSELLTLNLHELPTHDNLQFEWWWWWVWEYIDIMVVVNRWWQPEYAIGWTSNGW